MEHEEHVSLLVAKLDEMAGLKRKYERPRPMCRASSPSATVFAGRCWRNVEEEGIAGKPGHVICSVILGVVYTFSEMASLTNGVCFKKVPIAQRHQFPNISDLSLIVMNRYGPDDRLLRQDGFRQEEGQRRG